MFLMYVILLTAALKTAIFCVSRYTKLKQELFSMRSLCVEAVQHRVTMYRLVTVKVKTKSKSRDKNTQVIISILLSLHIIHSVIS